MMDSAVQNLDRQIKQGETAKLFENGFKTESAEPARLISATLSSMKSKRLLVKNERNLFVVPV